MKILKWLNRATVIAPLFFLTPALLAAQEKGPAAIPPARVVVAEVLSGTATPQTPYIGTVYYQEVSDVASEVEGLVEEAGFEEGAKIGKGEALVKLNADLLQKTIQATKASYEQVTIDLEKARIDLERVVSLYRERLAPEQEYDEYRFRVLGKEKTAESLKAELERLGAQLARKMIRAPFDGVVLQKRTNIGEWLSPGSPVATIARSEVVDIVVNVPEDVLKFIQPNQAVRVESGGQEIQGKVFTVIPKGDIATRTFPVKIRVQNNRFLLEGMEARVTLSTGRNRKSLAVPRDAVLTVFGKSVVFVVKDSKAAAIPVKVTGYKGMTAWVDSKGLREGMNVVIKGNERLRDGQPVDIVVQE